MQKVVLLVLALVFTGTLSFAEEAPNPNYPTVMVLMDNYTDGKMASRQSAATEIERIFAENNFPVVKQSEIKGVDIEDLMPVFTVYPGKIVKLGKKYGADAIIVGKATSDIVKTDIPYGTGVYTYQARIEGRIVKTDTGHVVAMGKVTYVAREEEKSLAEELALVGAARNISESLIQKVSAIWKKEVYRKITVELICENATPQKAELLKRAFKFTRGITSVKERSFKGGTLVLEIRFLGTSDRLVWLLRQFVEPVFDITASTPDKINIRFVKENKDFTSNKLRF
ncbi:MAG: hypothetical protein WBC74_01240 [Candidatus Omnitrophota bacterium]